jgi:predicted nucleic acid-binding protein
VIVVDTTILVYAIGEPHPLLEPSERLLASVARGELDATTTVDVIQEFAYVRARRFSRADAARRAREYAQLLSPLLIADEGALHRGLDLVARHDRLGSFDAVLAATALANDAEALVSADAAFASVRGLKHLAPGTREFDRLIAA